MKKIINNGPKFDRLTDREWQEATNSVKQLVKWRLNGSKTCSGPTVNQSWECPQRTTT